MATTTINLGLSLDGLSNVDSTGKATGDVLEWNAVTSKWEAATPSGGGAAGSNGQIQFNNSGAFGADSLLVWDNTNKRLGVGASPATTVRLDVRAQGALSTDVAFRVRNSANTLNSFQVNGNNTVDILGSDVVGSLKIEKGTGDNIHFNYYTQSAGNNAALIFRAPLLPGGHGSSNPAIIFNPTNLRNLLILNRNIVAISDQNQATLYSGFGTNACVFAMRNSDLMGGNPTGGVVDHFAMYSADIAAGNAAPHFRTENGAIIKLYQQSSAGITTVADLVTILQNTGLLS
jgi:hypothetical protein